MRAWPSSRFYEVTLLAAATTAVGYAVFGGHLYQAWHISGLPADRARDSFAVSTLVGAAVWPCRGQFVVDGDGGNSHLDGHA